MFKKNVKGFNQLYNEMDVHGFATMKNSTLSELGFAATFSKKMNHLTDKNKLNASSTSKKGASVPNRIVTTRVMLEPKPNEPAKKPVTKALSGSNHSINDATSLGDTRIVEHDHLNASMATEKSNKQKRESHSKINSSTAQLSKDLQVR